MKEVIGIRLDRNIWLKFMYKLKQNKAKACEVIEPMLKKYIKGDLK